MARIVVVGGGFAGFHAARGMKRLARLGHDVTVVTPTDYFLYLPLLPEVAAGLLEPRRICVSLPRTIQHATLQLGTVDRIDLEERTVGWTGPEGDRREASWDRLVLATGSVNKLLPIPGVVENAHGFRDLQEALYLRDHLTRQVELAAVATNQSERDERCTFVVVGAGYTGTEVAAQGQLFTTRLAEQFPSLSRQRMRWMILDTAKRLLPELDERLSRTSDRVLRSRGIEIRMGQSVERATANCVRLTETGEAVPTRSLIWCVGVRPDPMVGMTDLETQKGRLTVGADLSVKDHPDVFAVGDCAAVPDLTSPGELTSMTAQHAQRQGKQVASNVAASLGLGSVESYSHHDLGFLVDLGGASAAANPLHVPLAGWPAKAVTRAYHLASMPGNRARTASDWALNAFSAPAATQLGLVRSGAVPLDVEPDA